MRSSLIDIFPYRLPYDFPVRENLRITDDGRVEADDRIAALEKGPTGFYGLSHTENGRAVRLASAVNPAAEDLALVEKAGINPEEGVLCVGLGLGYYLEELHKRLAPEAPLWVMESRPELAAAALMSRDFSKIKSRPGFRLFIGPFSRRPWSPEDEPPAQILARPANLKFFGPEYPVSRIAGSASLKLRRAVEKVLIFQSDYYLDKEIAGTVAALGFETAHWHFQRGLTSKEENFKELLDLIKSFQPDMVLTVNHLGFDGQGLMDDLFTRLKLPVASWFVDSPLFILGDNRPSEYVVVFSWDSDYLGPLRHKGFHHLHYLPLAADENYFHLPAAPARPLRDLAFVGDTLTAATAKYLEKLDAKDSILDLVDTAALEFLSTREILPSGKFYDRLAERLFLTGTAEEKAGLQALITWRASRRWRMEILSAITKKKLTLAGDEHWADLLNIPAERCLPPLDYYSKLAGFYQTSRVNLNITSAQMKTGLNQRVFDVPACGGFLLTDHREQLNDLFEIGREVITYSTAVEARDLARWYLENDGEREKIIRAAYQRVQEQHLYRHRLADLLQVMEKFRH